MSVSLDIPYGGAPFMVGDWTVEPGLSRISCGEEEIYLEPKLIAVLLYLVAHADQVVSSNTLVQEIWDDRPMGDNPVYRCIALLRKAFGDDREHPEYIITVPKRGYRLIAPVTPVASARAVGADTQAPALPERPRRLPALMLSAIAVAVAAVALLVLFFDSGERGDTRDGSPLSLAVMPFSSAVDGAHVVSGSGLAEEVSQQLSEVGGLRVIAHNSVASLNGEDFDIGETAALLDADHLLTGHLQYDDDRLSVQGRLLNTRGETLWSQTFTAGSDELFSLTHDLVQGVADSLGVRFDPEWVTACGGTRNIAACRQYLMATEQIRNRGEHYKARALELFEEATILDPGFAAAYAGIARIYLLPGDEFPWVDAVREAELAIQRALELDDQSAEAYVAQATVLMKDRRGPCPPACYDLHGYAAAEEAARHAISLSPRSPEAHNILALTLSGQGRLSEAASHYQAALMHDPLNPVVNYNIALSMAYQGDYAGAHRYVREFIDRHPNPPPFMYQALALIDHLYGNFDKSLESLSVLTEGASGPFFDWLLTENYFNLGLFDRIEGILESREQTAYFDILFATTHQRSLIMQDRLDELDHLTHTLIERAGEQYGAQEQWPRWLQRVLGQNMFWAGHYDQAVSYLTRVHGVDGAYLNHRFIIPELDSLQSLGYSLIATGRVREGNAMIERTLELLDKRRVQGYEGLPELTVVEARAYAMQGRKALAVTTLRRAVAQGWRSFRAVETSDPRWSSVSEEPDFEALLARVRDEVDQMRARTEFRLARVD